MLLISLYSIANVLYAFLLKEKEGVTLLITNFYLMEVSLKKKKSVFQMLYCYMNVLCFRDKEKDNGQ